METKNTFNIQSIEIDNYRCFEHYKIDNLGDSTTIFIGKNGVGKTTLLRSITNLLSVFFSKSDNLGVRMLSSGNPDLTITNIPPSEIFSKEGIVADRLKCSAKAKFGEATIRWTISKKATKSSLSPTQYREAYKSFIKKIDNEGHAYPLLISFSDSFPHVTGKISGFASKSLSKGLELIKNFGYYQWDSENACTTLWELWFLNHWFDIIASNIERHVNVHDAKNISDVFDASEDANNAMLRISYVTNVVRKFFEDEKPDGYKLKHITGRLRGNNKRVVIFEFENGKKLTIGQLPAGYRRLISIVFDIAVRSVILNGLNTDMTGTVLIDEIDLHLHPSLEQNVVERFKRTFPNIQFIITTHSPLVISNFKQDENNKIIVMKEEDGQYSNGELTDIYGIGYDVTVSQVMKTPARNSDIEYLIDTYVRFKRRNKIEDANLVLQKLKEKTGRSFERISNEINQRLKEE